MIEFCLLPGDHPDVQHSPLLRAALLTLNDAHEHAMLFQTKSFCRVIVNWAAALSANPNKSEVALQKPVSRKKSRFNSRRSHWVACLER
jgi:hypothetical protein